MNATELFIRRPVLAMVVSLLILLGLGYVTLREQPTALGIAGVLLSMVGVYLLNVHRARFRASAWDPSARRPPLRCASGSQAWR